MCPLPTSVCWRTPLLPLARQQVRKYRKNNNKVYKESDDMIVGIQSKLFACCYLKCLCGCVCVCVYGFLVDSFMLLRVFGSFAYGTRKEMRKVSLVGAELRKVELSSVRPRSFSLTCVDCI